MNASEIRKKFLTYFQNNGHTVVDSSSLIPDNDKTLLFVNAGMVPFKNVFNGVEKRPYTRAVSSQKCVRAGGKHNDLENVGYTARHHTFFEMLGNFSFGDYFKKEAIHFAWNFLTKELKLPADKLWVSVYEEDDEAEDIWVNSIGFPKNRISRCGAKDNFWQMGDVGPCGPCSEIFYDHGDHIAGGQPGHADEDGDRFIEIWNLVFTQFDRQADGHLKPLIKPCVDTGMGLERIAAVMQHKANNYDIDLFTTITKYLAKLAVIEQTNTSVRVIADHIRSASFLIADGINPSNEGRGYVLRRIIRRAIRHGHKIGIDTIFFYRLAPILSLEMAMTYPELKQNLAHIESVLKKEEKRFILTLDKGMSILDAEITILKRPILSGKLIFKLYDTYGFPTDLTADIAKEKNLKVDMAGFKIEMEKQQNRARAGDNFSQDKKIINLKTISEFVGYLQNYSNSIIEGIIHKDILTPSINAGDEAIIVLNKTPFYPESGGQVGDNGYLLTKTASFKVVDTKKQVSGAVAHYGILESGTLVQNDEIQAKIDINNRKNIARNHSATHLLHAALRKVLGESVNQKGSLVNAKKLRFDFSYDDIIPSQDLDKIEAMVNRQILENSPTYTEVMDIKAAKKKGAMALFGEKYSDEVRVLSMGTNDFSVELCGGTHIKNLGDIGLFRIINESGISSGIRRIEALSGFYAYQYDKTLDKTLNTVASLVKSSPNQVVQKVTQLLQNQKQLEKQLKQLQTQVSNTKGDALLNKAQKIGNINLLSTQVELMDVRDLRTMVDKLKDKLGNAIVVLAMVDNKRISIIVGVSGAITNKYNAGKIINHITPQINGKGGGRADMAQGGGSNINQLENALASVKGFLG